jgi:hypothetical protein
MRHLLLLLLALPVAAADLLTGYRLASKQFAGPGEWRTPLDPVWVYAYPKLTLRYRASNLPKTDTPVLTLRPGSVGPVTPGATNPENPFVAGMPVTAVMARDLVADGVVHSLEVDLSGKMRTPQIDEIRTALPPGARLEVESLEFRGAGDLLPCTGGPQLPARAAKLQGLAEEHCGKTPATTLRGAETIRIRGNGRRGRTLYLSLFPHFTTVTAFAADQPPEKFRARESSETADFIVRLRYEGGPAEEQYPLSVDERRHVLVNRKAALYAVELDPGRTLIDADLVDRSVHAQFLLYAAGISPDAPPSSVEELPAGKPVDGRPVAPPDISASYKVDGAPADAIRAQFSEGPGRRLSLEVRNTGTEARDLVVTFPRVSIRPAGPAEGIYYLFPRQGAVIGRADRTLEANYNAIFPLQFVDVFSPTANGGAAVIVLDEAARGKRFRLVKTGTTVEVAVEYRVRLGPGETFRPPDAQITAHGGDWHEGLAAYRAWVASWYKPAGPRPAWLRKAFWARRDYPVGGSGKLYDVRRNRYTYGDLIRDGAAFGGIDFIDISGWAMSETSGRVGDYPIELGGADDLRRNVAIGDGAGIPTGLYFEGYLIDKRSKIGLRQNGRWQMIDAKGQGAWWKGGTATEFFACPYVRDWQKYLATRLAEVARETGVSAIYLDEFGFGNKRCYSADHGHAPGAETVPGEVEMAREVRRALAAAGRPETVLYIEETPPDASAPYYDAAFCYNLPNADRKLSPLKLNLWRFVFPDIRLWDMLSTGIDPRALPAEDFRLSLWHGNGVWLKGHSETWYGEPLMAFLRCAHGLLKENADALNGVAEPLVASPNPSVFINRFTGGGRTVYTLFNASYRTARLTFAGRDLVMPPREVEVVQAP